MSKPQEGFSPPDFSGQTKTMYCMEGNPLVKLMTKAGKGYRETLMIFKKAESALDWCRKNNSVLIYTPIAPSRSKN